MKIGMSTNNFPEENLDQIIGNAKGFGINYLELWPTTLEKTGENDSIYSFENRNVEAAKEKLDNAGIKVGCVASGIGFEKHYADDRNKFSKELINVIEIAHKFGAEVVLHYGTQLLLDDCLNADKLKFYWKDAADAAESYGIKMALENEPDDFTYRPDHMRRVLELVDSPAFMTNFDATNYFHSSEQAFPFGYMWLKNYIAYVHIKNGMLYNPKVCHEKCWIGTPMHGFLKPGVMYYTEAGRGVINNSGLLDMLHEDGYNGICTPEPQHTTHENACRMLKHDVAFLRKSGYFE